MTPKSLMKSLSKGVAGVALTATQTLSFQAHALNAKIDLATERAIRESNSTAELLEKANGQGVRKATPFEAFASDARKSKLLIPYFFQVPRTEFSPIPEETLKNSSKVMVVDQLRMKWSRVVDSNGRPRLAPHLQGLNDQVGLRWTILPQATDSRGRLQSATALAGSGMVQTGDIILSFRKEWYGSLPYSHLQLGVSHAGVALIDKNADGSSVVRNVDMPLDMETWGGPNNDHLASKHYIEAPFLHIIRPSALHDGENDAQERKNIDGWLRLIRQNASKFYKNPLKFNSDYMTSNYKLQADGTSDLTYVADLARLALGGRLQGQYGRDKGYSMYCSEFAWIILSLKDCDPVSDRNAFLGGETPTCVKPIMAPMPVLGNYHPTMKAPSGAKIPWPGMQPELGLADGAMMIADKMTELSESVERRNRFIIGTFTTADGKPEHISGGHLAVQNGILAKNPKFFDLLKHYFVLTGDVMRMNPAALGPQEHGKIQEMLGLQLGFNERVVVDAQGTPVMLNGNYQLKQGPLNYSPTAFLIHALVPRGEKLKAFEYVTSVMFMPEVQRKQVEAQMKNLN